MRKIIFILLFCNQILADENLFIQANKQYAEEKYIDAISLYDSIIYNGLESSELYYNLGNCYYKIKDWPQAIWYYKKSLSINPNNNDAYHNLNVSKLKTKNLTKAIPQLFYKKWIDNIINLLSLKNWQIFTIICIWIVVIIQILKIFTKFKIKHLLTLFHIFSLIILITTYTAYQKKYTEKEAIIFSSSTIVNSAPSSSGTNLFSLNPGNEIRIIDQIEDWVKIKTTDGRNGWIKKTDCKPIR